MPTHLHHAYDFATPLSFPLLSPLTFPLSLCLASVLQLNLGCLHTEGLGVAKNLKKARVLFALAAAQGNTYAAQGLAKVDEVIRTECPLLGKRVVIAGTSREDLNGMTGAATCTSFDHDRGRYVVALVKQQGSEEVALFL